MESTDVIVVPMEPKEALATAELISSVIQSLSYYNARAKEEEIAEYSPEKLVRSVEEDPHSVLVAKRGKEVVGFCLSRYDDGLIWLAWFGVKPEYRRQGIASQLLITLEKTVRQRKAHKIWCDTRTENLPSQTLLRRAGYRQVAILLNHWYGQDFYIWEKPVVS